jgi:excisionase family DNA binding protein
MRDIDNTDAVADYLHVPIKTVRQWRYTQTGPAAIKVGRHVRYRRSDVDRWLDDHRDTPRPAA